MASSRKITLRSSDGVVRGGAVGGGGVADDQAHDRGRLRRRRDPAPQRTSQVLAMVIEYCKKHVESATAEDRANDEDLRAWDAEFVKVDRATLWDLIMAANYLSIRSLLDLTCEREADFVSGMIKGKTLEEIRRILGMENELTLEELRTILGME